MVLGVVLYLPFVVVVLNEKEEEAADPGWSAPPPALPFKPKMPCPTPTPQVEVQRPFSKTFQPMLTLSSATVAKAETPREGCRSEARPPVQGTPAQGGHKLH